MTQGENCVSPSPPIGRCEIGPHAGEETLVPQVRDRAEDVRDGSLLTHLRKLPFDGRAHHVELFGPSSPSETPAQSSQVEQRLLPKSLDLDESTEPRHKSRDRLLRLPELDDRDRAQ